MSKSKTGAVWQDREVLFDLPFSYLRLRPGEKIFDRIEPIEDTKGNSGAKGRMVITNLRIIWHSLRSPRINLSIGLYCITSTSTKIVNSGLRGTTQALYVMAAYATNKYEFIFTNLSPNCVRHYTSVAGVHKAYAGSRLYRDLKLRSAVIQNKQLRVLHLEKICLREHGVWNLSSESGNLGNLLASNVRVVWFADVNEAFNVSMPYITIESITIRNSKFGDALVFVIHESSGGYVLGFRADPRERLQPLLSELQTLHQAYTEKPIFGVEMNWGNEAPKPTSNEIEELEEIGEPRGEMGPHLYLASQLSQNKEESTVQPVYSPYLGLAIEPLKEGLTLKSLFEVQATIITNPAVALNLNRFLDRNPTTSTVFDLKIVVPDLGNVQCMWNLCMIVYTRYRSNPSNEPLKSELIVIQADAKMFHNLNKLSYEDFIKTLLEV